MLKSRKILSLFLFASISANGLLVSAQKNNSQLTSAVDVFIGTENKGNTLPGAAIPWGFVRLSPDSVAGPTSGYDSQNDIIGFSHTHVSGTGGPSKYGNFRVMPSIGETSLTDLVSPKADEVAAPGYYSVNLTKHNIKAELTATRLVGFHRYTFPQTKQAQIFFDAGSIMRPGKPRLLLQSILENKIQVIGKNRLEGMVKVRGGWNEGPYTLYFSAEFDREFTSYGTWKGGEKPPLAPQKTSAEDKAANVGAYLTFDTTNNQKVQLKVGVSFISMEKARANILQETPDWNFEKVRQAASGKWENVLSKIRIEGASAEQHQIFYTALYHAQYMPSDLTGENVWWKSGEPHYEDFFCLWDTFRGVHPLLTLIQPERQRDIVRSLIDTYEHTGWMPDARTAGVNGWVQGGTNGDIVIADAMAKGLKGIDYEKAYKALVKNAEIDSPNPQNEGREVSDYKRLSYMPIDYQGPKGFFYGRSASRTLEYSYEDFCIAQIAKALGKSADYEKYLKRSASWQNLWDDATKSIRPRYADGRWLADFSPTKVYKSWNDPFYEGNAYQYSTYVPHDAQELINRLGGNEKFNLWLDEFFKTNQYNQSNEPDHLAAFLYIHAGQPARTWEIVRGILSKEYKTGRGGIPGNDDAGAMSAWYIWNSIGLFPSAGQPFYYLSSPIFKKTTITLSGGKHFIIEAPKTSDSNKYIQSATLNGKPLDRAWLKHSEIAAGGRLVLKMSAAPTDFGKNDRPPSVSKPGGSLRNSR